MLKVLNDFDRREDLLAKFDAVAQCYSASCVFADVMYRTGVMDGAIKPPFKAKAVGQAITVQLSKGDLVDPLKALEMGKPGDIIVVDAGGDTETSVCGGLMGGLAKNRGIRGMVVDGADRDIDELEDIGWPIWTRAITARGTHTMFSGRKEELSINVPSAAAVLSCDRATSSSPTRSASRWCRLSMQMKSSSSLASRPSGSRKHANGSQREKRSRICSPSSVASDARCKRRFACRQAMCTFGKRSLARNRGLGPLP